MSQTKSLFSLFLVNQETTYKTMTSIEVTHQAVIDDKICLFSPNIGLDSTLKFVLPVLWNVVKRLAGSELE